MKIKENKSKIINVAIVAIVAIAILILILNFSYIKYSNGLTLIQLQDNGTRQMMGYLLKTKNNTIVIDGGLKEDAQNLIDNINRVGGGKVDTWFLTHPHMDHVQAFIEIVQNTDMQIGKVYVTLNDLEWYKKNETERFKEIQGFFNILKNDRIKDKVEEVSLNQIINIDNLQCEILGIKNPEMNNNPGNNSSMVIKMNINKKSILFLADSGKESGEKLLQTQKNKLKSDIVQMAHHGQNGVNKNVYETIKPEICLWPTPEWLWNNNPGTGYNTGNWTTLETRGWMEELKVKKHYIEKDGDISFRVW